MQTFIEENKLKAIFKEALIELMAEKKDLFRELIMETLEDIALSKAIEEGESTEEVSREAVFNLLREGE
jgi:hypothetical protein